MWVRLQIEVVQERGQEHLEAILKVVVGMAEQKEPKVVLEERCVSNEHDRVWTLFI
jgi:hypothetical protein